MCVAYTRSLEDFYAKSGRDLRPSRHMFNQHRLTVLLSFSRRTMLMSTRFYDRPLLSLPQAVCAPNLCCFTTRSHEPCACTSLPWLVAMWNRACLWMCTWKARSLALHKEKNGQPPTPLLDQVNTCLDHLEERNEHLPGRLSECLNLTGKHTLSSSSCSGRLEAIGSP